MSKFKYKAGDEVIIKANILSVDEEDSQLPYEVKFLSGYDGWLSEEDIIKSQTEISPEKLEPFDLSKLVPGQKYDIPSKRYNTFTFVADLYIYGYKKSISYCFIDSFCFIDKNGDFISFSADELKNIKPHCELIKKQLTKWVAFDPEGSPDPDYTIDALSNLDTDGSLYESQSDAFASTYAERQDVARIDITITQKKKMTNFTCFNCKGRGFYRIWFFIKRLCTHCCGRGWLR